MSAYVQCDSDLCGKQEQIPSGNWWTIGVPHGDDDDRAPLERIYHFCSIECLSYWAAKRSNEEDAINA